MFDQKQPTLCFNLSKDSEADNLTYIKLPEEDFIEALCAELHARKIHSVLVEGGSHLLNSLIQKGLWDEARVFNSHTTFIH